MCERYNISILSINYTLTSILFLMSYIFVNNDFSCRYLNIFLLVDCLKFFFVFVDCHQGSNSHFSGFHCLSHGFTVVIGLTIAFSINTVLQILCGFFLNKNSQEIWNTCWLSLCFFTSGVSRKFCGKPCSTVVFSRFWIFDGKLAELKTSWTLLS